VYVDRKKALAQLVAALDLIVDPFAAMGLGPIEDDSHRCTGKLLFDPVTNAASSELNGFELGFVIKWRGLALRPDYPRIANLHNPKDISVVMKAEEYLARQLMSPCPRTN
jgi:hypothetical protein